MDQSEEAHAFEALVRSAEDAIVVAGLDGIITTWNRAAERMYGYTAEEAVGEPLSLVAPEGLTDEAEGLIKRIASAASVGPIDTIRRRKDGELIEISLNTFPVRDDSGEILAVAGIARDVTEERRRLREVSGLAAIVGASEDAIIGLTIEGTITSWNGGAAAMFGYPAGEVIGQNIDILSLPDEHERTAATVRRMAQGHAFGPVDARRLRKDGRAVDVAVSGFPIRDEEDRVTGIAAIIRDVSEQKIIESKLEFQAEHDPLTGLFNRRRFGSELRRDLAASRRYGAPGAVLMVDLDHFKGVNDTLGHAIGDRVLADLGQLLAREVRSTDIVARLGGDEFGVVLTHVDERSAQAAAKNLIDAVSSAMQLDEEPVVRSVTASCGVTLFGPDRPSVGVEELLTEADVALYRAKDAGRNRVVLHDREAPAPDIALRRA